MTKEEIEKEIEEKEDMIVELRQEIECLQKKKYEVDLVERFPIGRDVKYLGSRYKIDSYGVAKNGDSALYIRKYKKDGNISIKKFEISDKRLLKSVFLIERKRV